MVELNLEVDGEVMEFKVPESWSEVAIGEFSELFKLDREGMTDIEISAYVVSILTGIDEDTLFMMDADSFVKVANIVAFTNEDVKGEQVEFIELEGEKYYLKNDFDKLTMGEMVSLELLIEKSQDNLLSVMPEMLCIFLRKKKDNGKLEGFRNSFMERAELFRQIPITKVNDLFLFFSNGVTSLPANTKASLEKEKRK